MLLDWLFIGVFGWELTGAAVATALSQAVGGGTPLVYFAFKNSSAYHYWYSYLQHNKPCGYEYGYGKTYGFRCIYS